MLRLGPKNNIGFTLVELSIVLVVIGLIVGGIMVGKSLIDSSNIHAQVQQLEKYNTAYHTFKLKYNAIPGDMVNASDYWAGAVNGPGVGRLVNSAGWPYQIGNRLFFIHISLAGLSNENIINSLVLGVGYPELKISPGMGMVAGGQLHSLSSINGGLIQTSNPAVEAKRTAALYLDVSSPIINGSNQQNNNIGTLTPQQGQDIDRKIDDGKARQGKFLSHRVYPTTQGNCLTGVDGNYLISNTRNSCMGEYILE